MSDFDWSGGLQTALAEIRVPEKPGGNGAPRTPGCAERFEFFGRRPLAKTLHLLNCGGKREVAGGPDVRPTKRAQQINVGRPAADALEGHEHFVRGVVREAVEIAQVKVSAGERFGKQAGVKSFLPAEADAQQLGVIQPQEPLG